MRVPLFKRIVITSCNIFFPPLAVALLTGFTSSDTFLNSALFLLAIIPSHIHGFYISFVYFTRKRRARNGQYPGKPHKAGIWSERVLTGGVGWDEADRLKDKRARPGKRRHSSDTDTPRLSRRPTRQAQREDLERQGSRRSSQRRSMPLQQSEWPTQEPLMVERHDLNRSQPLSHC